MPFKIIIKIYLNLVLICLACIPATSVGLPNNKKKKKRTYLVTEWGKDFSSTNPSLYIVILCPTAQCQFFNVSHRWANQAQEEVKRCATPQTQMLFQWEVSLYFVIIAQLQMQKVGLERNSTISTMSTWSVVKMPQRFT